MTVNVMSLLCQIVRHVSISKVKSDSTINKGAKKESPRAYKVGARSYHLSGSQCFGTDMVYYRYMYYQNYSF